MLTAHNFRTMKSVALSAMLSTPQHATDYMMLTRQQTKSRGLFIKVRIRRTDAEGVEVLSKSGKPMFDWVDYNEFLEAQAA